MAVRVSASLAVDDAVEEKSVQRLLGIYQDKVVPALQEEYKYENKFEVKIRPVALFSSLFFGGSDGSSGVVWRCRIKP